MEEIVIEGRTITFKAFTSIGDAREYRERQSSIYYGLVLGDYDHPTGRYWVCGLGDAVRLDGVGYRMIS